MTLDEYIQTSHTQECVDYSVKTALAHGNYHCIAKCAEERRRLRDSIEFAAIYKRGEECVVCAAETGKMGKDIDSIYVQAANGCDLGPLCDDCLKAIRGDIETTMKDAEDAWAENDRLEDELAKAKRKGGA